MTATRPHERGRFVVTGPTGWVGQAVVAHLIRALGPRWRDDVTLFASSDRAWVAPDGRTAHLRDLRSVGPADVDGAFVVHLAHLGRERGQQDGREAFWNSCRTIDAALLGALGRARSSALFLASSGAAARAAAGEDEHPYGLSKLQQERDFAAWSVRSGVPLRLGRIWSVAGPHMTKVRHYALGDFVTSAIARGRVEVRSASPVVRSYLHVADLAALALDGVWTVAPGTPVDLCGEREVEVGEVAQAVAAAVSEQTGRTVSVQRLRTVRGAPEVYLGDPRWTLEAASSSGTALADFERQVGDTVADLLARNDDACREMA